MIKRSLLQVITTSLVLFLAIQQIIIGIHHENHVHSNHDPLFLRKQNIASNNEAFLIVNTENQHSAVLARFDEPKVLVFITTIFSQNHQNFFHCCWPKLMATSKLLNRAHVILFSNNVTGIDSAMLDHVSSLFSSNPSLTWKFAPEHELQALQEIQHKMNRFQVGANLGMKLGVHEHWFEQYDWVLRINPDVLIRNSSWIWQNMQDPNVDAILAKCSDKPTPRIHTDFFAIRPGKLAANAFWEMQIQPYSKQMYNHEVTADHEFRHMTNRKYLPDTQNPEGFCRVGGIHSAVSHAHTSCRNESNMICNALERWNVE